MIIIMGLRMKNRSRLDRASTCYTEADLLGKETQPIEIQKVNSLEQLQEIYHQLRTISFIKKGSDYQFFLPELSVAANDEVSQVLNSYKHECGCFLGGLFMGISTLCIVGYYLVFARHTLEINLRHVLLSIMFIITSALIGKMVGLLWARFQMIQVVNKTIAFIDEQKSRHFTNK